MQEIKEESSIVLWKGPKEFTRWEFIEELKTMRNILVRKLFLGITVTQLKTFKIDFIIFSEIFNFKSIRFCRKQQPLCLTWPEDSLNPRDTALPVAAASVDQVEDDRETDDDCEHLKVRKQQVGTWLTRALRKMLGSCAARPIENFA